MEYWRFRTPMQYKYEYTSKFYLGANTVQNRRQRPAMITLNGVISGKPTRNDFLPKLGVGTIAIMLWTAMSTSLGVLNRIPALLSCNFWACQIRSKKVKVPLTMPMGEWPDKRQWVFNNWKSTPRCGMSWIFWSHETLVAAKKSVLEVGWRSTVYANFITSPKTIGNSVKINSKENCIIKNKEYTP